MTETIFRLLPWLAVAASLALAVAAEGSTLAWSGWLFSALGWAAYGTTDAHRRRVLEEREETFQKWRDTIEKWKESSRR